MDFTLLLLTSLLSFLLGYLRYRFTYWELRGIPQLRPHFHYKKLSNKLVFMIHLLISAAHYAGSESSACPQLITEMPKMLRLSTAATCHSFSIRTSVS